MGADRTRGGNFEETFRRLGGDALIAVDRLNERSVCFAGFEAVDVDIGVRRNRTFVILRVKVLGIVRFGGYLGMFRNLRHVSEGS